MRKRVHKLCIFESRHEWMPFIWKTVSKTHTKGALGGKSVGLFSPWGPLRTRRQEEPMLNVCNFSILLIRTELSDTQDILPSRTQSRLWLSHTDAVLLKASSLALQTRAACFEVLLWRGEVSAVIGTLWGTWLSKEVSFKSHREGEVLGPHWGSCRGAGPQNEREADPGGPRPDLSVNAKRPC